MRFRLPRITAFTKARLFCAIIRRIITNRFITSFNLTAKKEKRQNYISILTLHPRCVRSVPSMFAVPGFWSPPVLLAGYTRATARGKPLQALKSLKSLEIRAQGSILQRRHRHVGTAVANVHDLSKKGKGKIATTIAQKCAFLHCRKVLIARINRQRAPRIITASLSRLLSEKQSGRSRLIRSGSDHSGQIRGHARRIAARINDIHTGAREMSVRNPLTSRE